MQRRWLNMSEAIQTVYLNESNHFQMESEQSLFCHMQKSKIDLHIVCQQDSKSHIFLFNQMDNGQLNIEIECKKDSYCMMSLLDLQSSGLNLSLNVNLKEEGAEFDIDTAQLCDENGKKKGKIEIRHQSSHTYGQIHNYAVLCENAYYEMWANGNIENGCHESQSHQKTRVLTLSKGHTAKVTPLLLIGENQVKASHALSIGQPNEEQLYYLQSRGLSKQQALGLLSIGYFMPVIHQIEDENQQILLQSEMERKVGLYGH